jgi:hypothetical protein
MVGLAACSAGQPGEETAPAVTAADCQGAWAVQVQNQTYEPVEIFYTRGRLGTQQRAGEINPQDTRILFFRSDPVPEVWAIHEGVRIFVHDRGAQNRHRVYLGLGCDTR